MVESGTDPGVLTFQDAVNIALRQVKDVSALAYLRAIPQARSEYGDIGVHDQIMYILTNLGTWRGTDAQRCKEAFKREKKRLSQLLNH